MPPVFGIRLVVRGSPPLGEALAAGRVLTVQIFINNSVAFGVDNPPLVAHTIGVRMHKSLPGLQE